MRDITDPRVLFIKGFLFLVLGVVASALLLIQAGDVRVATLLVVSIWAFCRFYYFAFYVIQHYVDPGYRFAGLTSFLHYVLRGGLRGRHRRQEDSA